MRIAIFIRVSIIAAIMTYTELIKHFGSQQAIATAVGLAQPQVSRWKHDGIPVARQCQLQLITGGKLVADRLQDEKRVAA